MTVWPSPISRTYAAEPAATACTPFEFIVIVDWPEHDRGNYVRLTCEAGRDGIYAVPELSGSLPWIGCKRQFAERRAELVANGQDKAVRRLDIIESRVGIGSPL